MWVGRLLGGRSEGDIVRSANLLLLLLKKGVGRPCFELDSHGAAVL